MKLADGHSYAVLDDSCGTVTLSFVGSLKDLPECEISGGKMEIYHMREVGLILYFHTSESDPRPAHHGFNPMLIIDIN